MGAGLRQRRDRLLAGLEGIPCAVPEGAIYLFPDAGPWMAAHGIPSDLELAGLLRDRAGLKVLPGTPFGAPGHLRLSFAAPLETLDKAARRFASFFKAPPN